MSYELCLMTRDFGGSDHFLSNEMKWYIWVKNILVVFSDHFQSGICLIVQYYYNLQ